MKKGIINESITSPTPKCVLGGEVRKKNTFIVLQNPQDPPGIPGNVTIFFWGMPFTVLTKKKYVRGAGYTKSTQFLAN